MSVERKKVVLSKSEFLELLVPSTGQWQTLNNFPVKQNFKFFSHNYILFFKIKKEYDSFP
jgi:hypothetical protein